MNINTKEYWETRFGTGDWEAKMGRQQTTLFAQTLIRHLGIPPSFSGKILDFGCGLGDAMAVYRKYYKHASLIGVDITEAAIVQCNQRYGDIAKFIQCDYTQIPNVDMIITCAVFEHLSNQIEVVGHLLTKCMDLYIIVPYKENLSLGSEHVNSYDENSFCELGEYDYTIFLSEGWSQYGWQLWSHVFLKNILRPFFGRKIVHRAKLIMFHFSNKKLPTWQDNKTKLSNAA